MNILFFPTLANILIVIIFIYILKKKIGESIFCDLGFIYISLLSIYTIIPSFVLIIGNLDANSPISVMLNMLSYNVNDINKHIWRFVLFVFSFTLGYLLFRGNKKIEKKELVKTSNPTIFTLIILVGFTMVFLSIFSAPVETYYENYSRYDHLPFFLRKIASVCIRFKYGFYSILITYLFLNYEKYKKLIIISVLFICIYELFFSHGARIFLFITLLQVFFLYSYFVRIISFKKIFLYSTILMLLFSTIEIFRLISLDSIDKRQILKEEGINLPGEIGAVFVSSFHLYKERENGTLPRRDWQMFFYDFISPFTFNSDTRWNPMYWYARNYFPEAEVPPFTLGPIADSAIWGGELDLFFRGVLNGLFFALIVRWFIRKNRKSYVIVIYTYIFSYSIITIKYTIFYYFTPIVKTLLPTLIIAYMIEMFYLKFKKNVSNTNLTIN